MHEMGMGITGLNPNRGTARNPHNDQHITGGSSSGSAAAVASGIVPFAIGSCVQLCGDILPVFDVSNFCILLRSE